MYAIPQDANPLRLLELVPQDVLGRAFTASGLPYTDELCRIAQVDIQRLADAAHQFMIMGAGWNRPDPV